MGANSRRSSAKDPGKEELRRKLTAEINKLRDKCHKSGLTASEVGDVLSRRTTRHRDRASPAAAAGAASQETTQAIRTAFRRHLPTVVLPICLGLLASAALFLGFGGGGGGGPASAIASYFDDPCLVGSNFVLWEIGRPLAACEQCRNMTRVPAYEDDISPAVFAARHAYTLRPALVRQATGSWSAPATFSFAFFRELYRSHPEALEAVENECQFFPYNTEFSSLREALFQMSDERAALREGEKHWYFGWSNCDPWVADELRRHYKRPHFLPESSESSSLDWIFMGGPGQGAGIHLDSVEKPSWQAQLSGTKTWTLLPLPECEDICHVMEVTVNTGDIIVLDTNQWYHTTRIHPGKISITIGSEFD